MLRWTIGVYCLVASAVLALPVGLRRWAILLPFRVFLFSIGGVWDGEGRGGGCLGREGGGGWDVDGTWMASIRFLSLSLSLLIDRSCLTRGIALDSVILRLVMVRIPLMRHFSRCRSLRGVCVVFGV